MIAKNVWLIKVKTKAFILFNFYHRLVESAFRFLSCDKEIMNGKIEEEEIGRGSE
jgi:hypothetical protein